MISGVLRFSQSKVHHKINAKVNISVTGQKNKQTEG